ncbi:MAG: competence/damage-inducible protein A [Acidimicrobiia bacterium]|nr:competence/damage-inducible protein A [Acidimicrobiia bacterium]
MRAEIVTVGTELLLGQIVDTNGAWLGQRLADIGVHLLYRTSVGDNRTRMAEVFARARDRADAVIVTGGLGPTQDDITREALSDVTRRPLVRDEDLASRIEAIFTERGRAMAASNLRQADVPEGATVIPLEWGTAPGLIVPAWPDGEGEHACVFYAVPGVPAEMRDMFERAVAPDIVRRMGRSVTIRSREMKTWGMSESRLAEILAPRFEALDSSDSTTLAFLAGDGVVRVRVTVRAASVTEATVALDSEETHLRSLLGDTVFGTDADTIESVCVDLLRRAGLSLAAAESMTGGMVGAWITRVPGSSDVFRGSAVTYATEAKTRVLGVPEDVLDRHGPVSEHVATAMAAGARNLFGADVAVAVTGSAGPVAQGGEVGETCLAVDVEGDVSVVTVRFPGDRERVRTFAVATLLDLLRRRLEARAADAGTGPPSG